MPFFPMPFSPYSNYFSSNVSRVELIPNAMSSRKKIIVDCWLFSNFLVKYEIDFFTRGHFIKGCIAIAYIDAIVTSFLFQFIIALTFRNGVPLLPTITQCGIKGVHKITIPNKTIDAF